MNNININNFKTPYLNDKKRKADYLNKTSDKQKERLEKLKEFVTERNKPSDKCLERQKLTDKIIEKIKKYNINISSRDMLIRKLSDYILPIRKPKDFEIHFLRCTNQEKQCGTHFNKAYNELVDYQKKKNSLEDNSESGSSTEEVEESTEELDEITNNENQIE